MRTVILDTATWDRLRAAGLTPDPQSERTANGQGVELWDESGRRLGTVTRAGDLKRFIELIGEENWLSDAEWDRLAQEEGPRYTTARVLEHLKGLSE